MANALVALGSNLGDRKAYLTWALEQLGTLADTKVARVSRFHETAPVGGPPQGMYLNAVAELHTQLEPQALLRHLQTIETSLGRPEDHVRWGPRVIDLDLLAYDALVLETPDLILPHPRMHERQFVLTPLAEVAPHWVHPKLGKSAASLLELLSCKSSKE